jgi:acetate kinase
LSLTIDPHSSSLTSSGVVCHDTTMGFTPLDGLMMGTRSGSLDPSILSYLCQEEEHSLEEVMNLLNKKSGLLGVSGLTQDVRDLLSHLQILHPTVTTTADLLTLLSTPTPTPSSSTSSSTSETPSSSSSSSSSSQSQRVILAINMFCHRAAKELLGLMASLESPLDALVFTGGIGENSPLIRIKILSHLKALGRGEKGTIHIDMNLNEQNQFRITTEDSGVEIFVIPTNEELQIAIETHNLINQ